jgi:hypothetical protein
VVSSFKARPSAISAGEGSKLSWSVSDATHVTIEPGIGRVNLKETRAVYPTETTIYTLTATNDAGRVDATAEVIVEEVNRPVINFFMASPKKISAGENSELSWSVSGATSVALSHPYTASLMVPHLRETKISPPEIIVQQRETKIVSPTETTTYTLTATNETGRVDKRLKWLLCKKNQI